MDPESPSQTVQVDQEAIPSTSRGLPARPEEAPKSPRRSQRIASKPAPEYVYDGAVIDDPEEPETVSPMELVAACSQPVADSIPETAADSPSEVPYAVPEWLLKEHQKRGIITELML